MIKLPETKRHLRWGEWDLNEHFMNAYYKAEQQLLRFHFAYYQR